MQKFGVEEEPQPKTASFGSQKICPKCRQRLLPQEETGVLLCPLCGSQPFEAPTTNGAKTR